MMGVFSYMLFVFTLLNLQDEERDSSGTKCRDVILNADRIQIIVQIYDFILGLWSQSYCSGTFILSCLSTMEPLLRDQPIHTRNFVFTRGMASHKG